MLEGRHDILHSPTYGDWSIGNEVSLIHLKDLEPYLTEDNLQTIEHEEIGWKGRHLTEGIEEDCLCCNGNRYKTCDIKYPGILSLGAPNHYSKKYRMIDGKHRMMKMRKLGITESLFYVLAFEDLKKFIKKINGENNP